MVVCRVDITSLTQQILCSLYMIQYIRRTVAKISLCPHSFPTVAIALFYTQFLACLVILLDFHRQHRSSELNTMICDAIWNTYKSTSLCDMGMRLIWGTPYSSAYGVLLLCYGAGDVEYMLRLVKLQRSLV